MENIELYFFPMLSFFAALLVFFVAFGIYNPNTSGWLIPMTQFDIWRKKYRLFFKILSIFIVVSSMYRLYNVGNNGYKRQWTDQDKKEIIQGCLGSAKTASEKFPEITYSYCECIALNIMKKSTYIEYMEMSKRNEEEIAEFYKTEIKECFDLFKLQIKKATNKNQ